MSSTIRRTASLSFLLVSAFLAAGSAAAQTPCFDPESSRLAVYYSSPNNNISCVIDFATGQSRSVIAGGQGTNFKGLAVLFKGVGSGGGLSIVAANSTQTGDIQVFDCDDVGEQCVPRGVAAAFSQAKGVALDTFIARIKTALPVAGKFTECPVGLQCRNAPGELIARAESAAFLACGAKQSCQRVLE